MEIGIDEIKLLLGGLIAGMGIMAGVITALWKTGSQAQAVIVATLKAQIETMSGETTRLENLHRQALELARRDAEQDLVREKEERQREREREVEERQRERRALEAEIDAIRLQLSVRDAKIEEMYERAQSSKDRLLNGK